MFSKEITPKNLLIAIFSTSFLALFLAYISQYGFGLQPCELCFWQRKPFFIIIIIALLFLTIPSLKKYQDLAIKISILLLLANAAIALYHFGVEQKWFKGLSSCGSFLSNPTTLEELKLSLENTKAVRCDEPQFVFLKISMAGWNVLYCLGLAIIFTICRRNYKK
ncbi:MAG: disulfide bond formation protein [Rickettsiaceae bacterium]|jgi:disulfide bond formation protein DsbB|nr:disulfide bond formation protein [Rickettsiaceae bacterium]